MPNRVFISYRREDGAASARSICDRLTQVFGSANIFMDVNSLVPGQRFDVELDTALSQCKVFLAIIGPRWMELLEKRERDGEHDYVRQELATALRRNMIVIPVLAEGARLPRSASLPPDISAVVMHQKQEVTHERFVHDVNDLIRAIQLGTGQSGGARWRYWAGAGAAAALAIAALLGRRLLWRQRLVWQGRWAREKSGRRDTGRHASETDCGTGRHASETGCSTGRHASETERK